MKTNPFSKKKIGKKTEHNYVDNSRGGILISTHFIILVVFWPKKRFSAWYRVTWNWPYQLSDNVKLSFLVMFYYSTRRTTYKQLNKSCRIFGSQKPICSSSLLIGSTKTSTWPNSSRCLNGTPTSKTEEDASLRMNFLLFSSFVAGTEIFKIPFKLVKFFKLNSASN